MCAWQDVLMDEDNGLPVPAAKEDLPSDNEKEGEDNGWGSEASGALSEDDDPSGMKDVPDGEDEISGTKSTEYDDVLLDSFYDEDEEEKEDDKEEEEESSDDEEKEEKEEKDEDTKDYFEDNYYDEEGGLPVDPVHEDLPSDNEKEGEDNGWDSEAAGALSEDDTDPGMKDVPRGKDPITGTTSTEYDDCMGALMNSFRDEYYDEDDEKEDKGDDDKDQGEEEGSDDDGASKDDDTKGEDEEDEKKDDDTKDEYVDDFEDFFVDADTEIPDGPEGTKLEPADPVDGNGNDVCPIGDPDLPSNLTEPVVVPSDDPGTKDELLGSFREDARFSFGDF